MAPVATTPTGVGRLDTAAGTLGGFLYADSASKPVSEGEWASLVQAIAGGDQRALRALYERTHRVVFTLIMRISNDRQTAEELTVDVFHDVWRRAAAYDPADGPVLGWIMNQARSRAIDRQRFERRKKRVNPYPDNPLPPAAPRSPHEALGLAEQGRHLRVALQSLAPVERQAIEVAYFSGLTYAQAAERLDEPLGTVKTRIRSGLSKLRQALAAEEDSR